MDDDDDISEFGSQAIDPDVLCTRNEFRYDGWVLIKENYPFRLEDVAACRMTEGDKPVGQIFVLGFEDEVSCNDEEKMEIYQQVSKNRAQQDALDDGFPIVVTTLGGLFKQMRVQRLRDILDDLYDPCDPCDRPPGPYDLNDGP